MFFLVTLNMPWEAKRMKQNMHPCKLFFPKIKTFLCTKQSDLWKNSNNKVIQANNIFWKMWYFSVVWFCLVYIFSAYKITQLWNFLWTESICRVWPRTWSVLFTVTNSKLGEKKAHLWASCLYNFLDVTKHTCTFYSTLYIILQIQH